MGPYRGLLHSPLYLVDHSMLCKQWESTKCLAAFCVLIEINLIASLLSGCLPGSLGNLDWVLEDQHIHDQRFSLVKPMMVKAWH